MAKSPAKVVAREGEEVARLMGRQQTLGGREVQRARKEGRGNGDAERISITAV